MIIVLHNYKRDEECILTAKSIRRLFPGISIEIISYSPASNLLLNTNVFNQMIEVKTKHENLGLMSCNKKNGLVFIEAINDVMKFYGEIDDKVLILDEHSYMLGPQFINEILANDFDLGWYSWKIPGGEGMAGDKLVINPAKLKKFFPLIEGEEYVEKLLKEQLVDKVKDRVHKFKTIDYTYRVDGSKHTNKLVEMKEDLARVGIM